jgi:iron complex outermembrane recepter protein
MKKQLVRLLTAVLVLCCSFGFTQTRQLQGLVIDAYNHPLSNVAVQIKNTAQGTVTDLNGAFNLPLSSELPLVLVFSSLGFSSQELLINSETDLSSPITLTLKEAIQILDELIVTGVFDSRKRIESSIAITTLDTRVLERMVPNSATELLRQVPGVFTNTSRGEIFNGIAVRGMILGGNYYYVSMQEDGLPIIPAQGQYNPDGFLRADISLGRLEAVRGGTARCQCARRDV